MRMEILRSLVLAEGDEASLLYFEDLVRSDKPELALVDTIEVSEFSGKVISLEKISGSSRTR